MDLCRFGASPKVLGHLDFTFCLTWMDIGYGTLTNEGSMPSDFCEMAGSNRLKPIGRNGVD
ncbi:hypothetical protein Pan258_35960 [Symmachiella dynata]|nr:hypothetical protein Pan258_35960 [Symmachiella dynata]